MASKICHVVRITNPNDDDMWVEVKVYDVIRFKGPNGQDMVIDFRNSSSFCDDQSPDASDNGAPSNGSGTRHTTMRRVTNPDDDTYYLDLEFLDYVRFKGPGGKDGVLYVDSARSGYAVVDADSTGATGNGGTSTVCSTIKVVAPDNDKESEFDEFIGVCVPNGIRFKGENGQESVLYLPDGDEEDTTVYTTDDDGNDKAPENTDDNKYVTWADAQSTGDGPGGPWVKNGDDGFGVNQGFLWHITKAQGGHTKPWWLFLPNQQEKQWTGVLAAHRHVPFIGYDIDGIFDYYRAEYGHHEDFAVPDPPRFPGKPIPPSGFDSADAQQRAFIAGTGTFVVGTGAPSTAGPVVKVIFDPDPTTGPGIVPEQPYTIFEAGQTVGVWEPNIWELSGIPQPFKKDQNGNDYIDPDTGKKVPKMPSAKVAKTLVTAFVKAWNDTSNAYNTLEASFDGVRRDGRPTVYIPYPDTWAFAVMGAVPNASTPSQRHYFMAGIPPGHRFFDGELNAARSLVATALLIGIEQLDPKIWDLSTDNPVLWSPTHPRPGS